VFDTFFHFILDLSWLLSIILFLRLYFVAVNLHFNSNKILLFILLTILFILIKHLAGDYLNYLYGLNVPIGLTFNTPLACSIPILSYLYVKKILSADEDIDYSDINHLLVFMIFYLMFELRAYKEEYIKNLDINSHIAYWEIYLKTNTLPDWLIYLKNILNITYSILSYRLIIKTFGLKSSSKGESFLKKLLNKFTLVKSKSKQVEKTRLWAYNITNLKFLLTLISLYFGISYTTNGHVVNSHDSEVLIVSLLILISAIYLNKNKKTLFILPSYTKLNSLKKEKVKEEIKINEIYEYMFNQIEDNKFYLDEKFRIKWLSEELDIKVEHINVTLNEYNFKNFSKFSNYLKINKAKELIKEGYLKKYNIDALAAASGFRATNTFYRIFKKEVGYTPKEYSENHNQ
jgi:AraC-like DNA-binding protein